MTPDPRPQTPDLARLLTPERTAALVALLPSGLLILGVVAVVVLAGKKPAGATTAPVTPPPPPSPVTPPAAPPIEESPPVPVATIVKAGDAAPSPEPTIATAA